MRVVLTANFSPWSAYSGGGQRSTHELGTALSSRGHEVCVVFTRPPWERVPAPADLPYRLRWAAFVGLRSRSGAPLRSLNAVTVARAVRALLDEAPAGEPVVVHAQGEEGALLPRLRRARPFGLVVTPRYPSFPRGLLPRGRGPVARARRALVPPKYLALGPALRGADRWCPTSESAARDVAAAYGLSRARCTVVPNGVAAPFLAVTRRAEAARGPVVFFGRLAASKGGDTLLRALAALGPGAPRALLVGRGPEGDALRRLVRELGLEGRVEIAGWRSPEALAESLAGASMAVLPSREESFGNTMAEAMAAGTPLISTRVGSVPEVVVDGRTGLLVPPGEPGALAAAMRAVLADPEAAERMGSEGRRHVRERFSWDATARAFEAVYAEVSRPGAT